MRSPRDAPRREPCDVAVVVGASRGDLRPEPDALTGVAAEIAVDEIDRDPMAGSSVPALRR